MAPEPTHNSKICSAGLRFLSGLKCSKNSSATSTRFSDSGRGIEPEFQKQAFERFQSRPIPGGHRGPGLGLSIVKSFVELHEGQVSLLSKVNQGTTVLCTFPIGGPAGGRRAGEPAEPRRMA